MVIFEHPVYDGAEKSFSLRKLFPDLKKPLKIEIGFGNGIFVFKKAVAEPNAYFIGVELYHRGIKALAKRIRKANIKNLIIVYGDAKKFVSGCILDNELAGLYINFPDPWPKKRHKKRRLVNVDFAKLAYLKLKDKGSIYLATDSKDYSEEMVISFEGIKGYKNVAGRLNYAEKLHDNVNTKYEEKFIAYGKKIYYLQYQVQKQKPTK